MAVTNYYSVGGAIIGERTAGSPMIDYLTDALGSVTATVDQTGTVQNTYRYKPYGAQLVKTGTAPDPKFTWVGEHGYRQTANKYSDVFVRARHYSSLTSRWTSKDTLRYIEDSFSLYAYVSGDPNSFSDPSGLQRGGSGGSGPIVVPIRPVAPPPVEPAPSCPPGMVRVIGGIFGPLIGPTVGAIALLCACPASVSKEEDNPCLPCPPRPPRTDCPPSAPHYIKPLGCCDWPNCHTVHFTAHQGPPPACKCNYTEKYTCSGPLTPGKCPERRRGGN